jgi:hypothetical protein
MTAGHPARPGRVPAGAGPPLCRETPLTRLSRRYTGRPASLRVLGPVVLVAAIAVAGCGTTSGTPAPSSSAKGGTSSFRQCLAKHGVTPPAGHPSSGTHHAPPAGGAASSFRKAIQACGGGGGFGGGGFGGGGGGFGGGVGTAGPFVLAGSYKVSLIVDGKTIDTKTLRVNDDPEVNLTSVEKKRMFDEAMEMQALQGRVTEAATAHASLRRQLNELAATVGDRSDVAADVKSSLETLKKDLESLAPRLAIPQGGRGGGGRGTATESLLAKIGQAKNGLMAGMSPGEQTNTAYADVRVQSPKAIADLNTAIAKAATLAGSLSRYNLTLTVPQPVRAPDAASAKKTSNSQRQ